MKVREMIMIVALTGVIVGSASAAGLIPPPRNEACPTIFSDFSVAFPPWLQRLFTAFQVIYD